MPPKKDNKSQVINYLSIRTINLIIQVFLKMISLSKLLLLSKLDNNCHNLFSCINGLHLPINSKDLMPALFNHGLKNKVFYLLI